MRSSNLGQLNTAKHYGETRRDLEHEFGKWGIAEYFIPRSADAHAEGPGVSLWFVKDQQRIALELHTFPDVETNLRAIYLLVEAVRKADQRGIPMQMVADVAARLALADPNNPYHVLGLHGGERREDVVATYRQQLHQTHPDHGGTQVAFERVHAAGKALGLS